MVLDIRRVSERFIPPDDTDARSAARLNQIDIECAFNRIASQPSLFKLTVLPPNRRAYLVVNCLRLMSVLLAQVW